MGFLRRLFRKRVASPDFAREVARTTVRVATDREATRPLMAKIQKEEVPAPKEKVRREVAFLLHYVLRVALLADLRDAEKGTNVFQQVTDRLVVRLNHEGLWPAERGPELEQIYYSRLEEFIQRLEQSTLERARDLFYELSLVTKIALFEDPEEAERAVESQMELMTLAEGYYERMSDLIGQIWIDLEQAPVEWPHQR